MAQESTKGALGRQWMFVNNIAQRCDRQRREA